MSYVSKEFGTHESTYGGMAVPPHDHLVNTYTGDNITTVQYYRGGQQENGTLVAQLDLTYDVSGNILTVTRTV
jgi:hypothetical protein